MAVVLGVARMGVLGLSAGIENMSTSLEAFEGADRTCGHVARDFGRKLPKPVNWIEECGKPAGKMDAASVLLPLSRVVLPINVNWNPESREHHASRLRSSALGLLRGIVLPEPEYCPDAGVL